MKDKQLQEFLFAIKRIAHALEEHVRQHQVNVDFEDSCKTCGCRLMRGCTCPICGWTDPDVLDDDPPPWELDARSAVAETCNGMERVKRGINIMTTTCDKNGDNIVKTCRSLAELIGVLVDWYEEGWHGSIPNAQRCESQPDARSWVQEYLADNYGPMLAQLGWEL